jgi:small subunit ribosomal protein S16
MQRLGRKGHPTYRVVVQDSRQSPTSGKYVALLGSYDPHTKQSTLVKDKAEFYLTNGARPSDRVAALFKSEKIKLPDWVREPTKQERSIRNIEKLRRNRPAEEAPAEKPAEETGESQQENAKPAEAVEESTETDAEVTQEAKPADQEPETNDEKTEETAEAETPKDNPEDQKSEKSEDEKPNDTVEAENKNDDEKSKNAEKEAKDA